MAERRGDADADITGDDEGLTASKLPASKRDDGDNDITRDDGALASSKLPENGNRPTQTMALKA